MKRALLFFANQLLRLRDLLHIFPFIIRFQYK